MVTMHNTRAAQILGLSIAAFAVAPIALAQSLPSGYLYQEIAATESFYSGAIGINADGVLGLFGTPVGEKKGVYIGTGTSLTLVADEQPYLTGIGFGGSINKSRTISFYAVQTTNPAAERIYTANASGVSPFPGSNGAYVSTPSINDSGMVAYRTANSIDPHDINASGTAVGFWSDGVYSVSAGSVATPIFLFPPFNPGSLPSINDGGTVAYASLAKGRDEWIPGLFTGSGGPVTTVASATGVFKNFETSAINNSGNVAFVATLDDGSMGIYVATPGGAQIQKIIGSGDVFLGSTIQAVSATQHSLNDDGQVAFAYILADGRTGVARADPDIAGMSPGNPILPPDAGGDHWEFRSPGARRWYDPILANGYLYTLTGEGSFLEVMVASGFFDLQIVVDGVVVEADLDAGESYFFASGVKAFAIVGILPPLDGSDPSAFPTFLDFSGSPTRLTMTALPAVPEPVSAALFAVGLLGLGMWCRATKARNMDASAS